MLNHASQYLSTETMLLLAPTNIARDGAFFFSVIIYMYSLGRRLQGEPKADTL